MKKVICIILSAILILSVSVSVFADSEKEMAAKELEKYGIVERNHLGALTIDGPVTRAGMVKMLMLMVKAEEGSTERYFTDVPAEHWAFQYIAQASNLGIINGMGDGTFAPDDNITYEQAMKMIVCALGYGRIAERRAAYPIGYAIVASNLGVTPHSARLSDDANRGDIMIMLAKALDVPIVVPVETENGTEYKVQNGENGESFVTLRTKLEK